MIANPYRTASEEETIALGRQIGAELTAPCCVLLIGNLGAGKTTLTKGIVAGLTGLSEDEISSPTFTLIHEYAPRVYHVDLYRLDTAREVASLGLEDLLDDSIVLIEWGERFPELFPAHRVEIEITARGTEREFQITQRSPGQR